MGSPRVYLHGLRIDVVYNANTHTHKHTHTHTHTYIGCGRGVWDVRDERAHNQDWHVGMLCLAGGREIERESDREIKR